MYSRFQGSVPPARGRRNMQSLAPAGKVSCPKASRNTNPRRTWCGLLGRTYCTGTPKDYEAVHAIQDQYSVVPLSSYGKPYTPPAGKVDQGIDMKKPVREQVNSFDSTAYFNLLASPMKDNPPAAADAPILAKMARLGIVPGKEFDPSKLDPAVGNALKDVPKLGVEKIMGQFKNADKEVNGWKSS